jgi:meso-butanediol dehydrogenase/(S,S)-butanediol dehydrogenase/diacetyl reductase
MYVLVTGCLSGIGYAICEKFKHEKWIVIGTDIIEKVNHNNIIDIFYKIDLSDEKQIDLITNEIKQLDCLVNVAAYQIEKPFNEITKDEFNKVLDMNVLVPFILIQKFHSLLKMSHGNIINIGSVHAISSRMYLSSYACSKSALVTLTKSLALELASDGIRINCVSPGCTDTPRIRKNIIQSDLTNNEDEIMLEFEKKYPLGKIARSYEIAEAVYFLADNTKSGNTTGSNFVIDGGTSFILSY